jgi:hypothetical protein
MTDNGLISLNLNNNTLRRKAMDALDLKFFPYDEHGDRVYYGKIKCDWCGKFIAHKNICQHAESASFEDSRDDDVITLCPKCNLKYSGGN